MTILSCSALSQCKRFLPLPEITSRKCISTYIDKLAQKQLDRHARLQLQPLPGAAPVDGNFHQPYAVVIPE